MNLPTLAIVTTMVAAAAFLAHCPSTERCSPGTTRCRGHVAELCSANGFYHELADCDRVSEQSGAAFTCDYVEEPTDDGLVAGHTCVLAADAGVTGGGAR